MSNIIDFPWGKIAFIAVHKPSRTKSEAAENKPEKYRLRLIYDGQSKEAKQLQAKLKEQGLKQFGRMTDTGEFMVVASSKKQPKLINELGENLNSQELAGFNSSNGDSGEASATCVVLDTTKGPVLYLSAVAVRNMEITQKATSVDNALEKLKSNLGAE